MIDTIPNNPYTRTVTYAIDIQKLSNRFTAVLRRDGKYIATESFCDDMDDSQKRRFALDILDENIRQLMRQNSFPDDAPVFKKIESGELAGAMQFIGYRGDIP